MGKRSLQYNEFVQNGLGPFKDSKDFVLTKRSQNEIFSNVNCPTKSFNSKSID